MLRARNKPVQYMMDPAGFPIDMTRPVLNNLMGQGQNNTEISITVRGDEIGQDPGRWYNIPSIVGGQYVGDSQAARQDAQKQLREGYNYPNFTSIGEAEQQAPIRSQAIGVARGLR